MWLNDIDNLSVILYNKNILEKYNSFCNVLSKMMKDNKNLGIIRKVKEDINEGRKIKR
ncbi:MAG: hypothetical protein NC483_00160 [Ruminococcus sp.]|nr:hypothetical protein [Ruminococcus sp.]